MFALLGFLVDSLVIFIWGCQGPCEVLRANDWGFHLEEETEISAFDNQLG